MPPKARITSKMIIDAAFKIAQEQGAENINARTVSKRLNCSTQPIIYYFKTIEELKKAVYQKADEYHSEYLMKMHSDDPIKDIGLNYIRFGLEEKNLFRFLFQSNQFSGSNILELIDAEEIRPVIDILSSETKIDTEQAKTVFRSVFLYAHGYASMLANNELTFNEERVSADLDLILYGTLCVLKGYVE